MGLRYYLKELRYYTLLEGSPKRVIYNFLFSKTPLSKLVNGRLYKFFYRRKVEKFTRTHSPRILQIENTNLCNARCIMCPHSTMKRGKRIMSLDNFKKIVDEVLTNYKEIKIVTITGFGEPTMDKTLVDKIKYINDEYPKVKIDIFTNGGLLSKELSDGLLKRNIRRINFSINAMENNYKKITGLDYKKVKGNFLYLMKRKKELNKKFPLVNCSLMVLKENEKDIDEFIKFWSSYGDSVMTYLPLDWAGDKKVDSARSHSFNKRFGWPCLPLWKNITVDVEGDVIMCCQDYESKVKFGNVLKEPIKEIMNSEKFNKIRELHKKGIFSMPVCKTCDNWANSSLWWWTY
ncbi:MAG: radical SAM protein [archaeon]